MDPLDSDLQHHRICRQIAKPFIQLLNWDSPTPSPAGECAPPPLVPGGGALSCTGEGVPIPTSGDIHCGTLGMIVLCVKHYSNTVQTCTVSTLVGRHVCTYGSYFRHSLFCLLAMNHHVFFCQIILLMPLFPFLNRPCRLFF